MPMGGVNGPPSKRMRTTNRPFGPGSGPIAMDISDPGIRMGPLDAETEAMKRARFTVSAYLDKAGHTAAIQEGEFLFALKARDGSAASTENCLHVATVTRLNHVLATTHLRSALEVGAGDPNDSILPSNARTEHPSLRDPSDDIMQRMIPNNPFSPANFSKNITYLGPRTTPGSMHAADADNAGRAAGFKLHVIESCGLIYTANMWMGQVGDSVGFIVKKFQDHTTFRDVDAKNIMSKLRPMQVYPVIASLRKGLTAGRRLGRSTVIDELSVTQENMREGGITREMVDAANWTTAERSVELVAHPHHADAAYIDYKVEVIIKPDGSRMLVGTPEFCIGEYIHVGVIVARKGPIPAVEQVNAAILGNVAVSGPDANDGSAAWESYIQLLNDHGCYVQVSSGHPHTFFNDSNVF